MTILILQTGEPLDIDKNNLRPMRSINLCEKLYKDNIKVELISSVFDHTKKIHRKEPFHIKNNHLRETLLLKSPGYKSNISFGRLFDHSVMALSLLKYLIKKKDKPKLVFIGFPPIETSFIMVIYCIWNKIPYILDIKDLWPFIFFDYLPSFRKKTFSFFLAPYIYMANVCSYNSKFITGPSKGYINSIKKFYKINPSTKTFLFPLSSDINCNIKDNDINYIKKYIRNKNAPVISFAGSFMRSAYDFITIKKALEKLKQDKVSYNFIIAGEGELKEELLDLFSSFKNIVFVGWLDRPKLEVLYGISSALIAPYKNSLNYKGHIPNKVYDSFRASKPLITSLEGDASNLINKFKIGFIYKQGDHKYLSAIFKNIITNKNLIKKMEINIKKNLNKILPRDEAYNEIISLYKSKI